MEYCRGVGDWLNCLKCPSLCTKDCPLEGHDVVNRLATFMEHTKMDQKDDTIDIKYN